MLRWFYCLPLRTAVICITAIIILSGMLFYYLQRKLTVKSYISILAIASFFAMFLICIATLYNRNIADYKVIITPFYFITEAKTNPEAFRTMMMNVFLFVPFGIATSQLLNHYKTLFKSIIYTLCIALLISLLIETSQYAFSIGLVQTDDIICNSFGTCLGSISILISKIFKEKLLNNYDFK